MRRHLANRVGDNVQIVFSLAGLYTCKHNLENETYRVDSLFLNVSQLLYIVTITVHMQSAHGMLICCLLSNTSCY